MPLISLCSLSAPAAKNSRMTTYHSLPCCGSTLGRHVVGIVLAKLGIFPVSQRSGTTCSGLACSGPGNNAWDPTSHVPITLICPGRQVTLVRLYGQLPHAGLHSIWWFPIALDLRTLLPVGISVPALGSLPHPFPFSVQARSFQPRQPPRPAGYGFLCPHSQNLLSMYL